MACFYAMEELDIPFEEVVLLKGNLEELEKADEPVTAEVGEKKITLQSGTVRSNGKLQPIKLYTLRVCKDCRADWMQAIQDWYAAGPKQRRTGTGVWLREKGSNREATPEEVEQMKRQREQDP